MRIFLTLMLMATMCFGSGSPKLTMYTVNGFTVPIWSDSTDYSVNVSTGITDRLMLWFDWSQTNAAGNYTSYTGSYVATCMPTVVSGPTVQYARNQNNILKPYLYFDKIDDRLIVGDYAELTLNVPFTLAVWCNRQTTNFVHCVASKYKSSAPQEWFWQICNAYFGNQDRITIYNNNTTYTEVRGPAYDMTNEWVLLSITWDGNVTSNKTEFSHYTNAIAWPGTTYSKLNAFTNFADSANPLNIGAWGNASYFWQGAMGAFAIWSNRVLTTEEMLEYMIPFKPDNNVGVLP